MELDGVGWGDSLHSSSLVSSKLEVMLPVLNEVRDKILSKCSLHARETVTALCETCGPSERCLEMCADADHC